MKVDFYRPSMLPLLLIYAWDLPFPVPVFDFALTASPAVPLGFACGKTFACFISDSSAIVLIVVQSLL